MVGLCLWVGLWVVQRWLRDLPGRVFRVRRLCPICGRSGARLTDRQYERHLAIHRRTLIGLLAVESTAHAELYDDPPGDWQDGPNPPRNDRQL